jgi:hypothetical protein
MDVILMLPLSAPPTRTDSVSGPRVVLVPDAQALTAASETTKNTRM